MVVVVDPDRAFRARVIEQLASTSDVLELGRIPEFDELLAKGRQDLAVVVLGPGLRVDGGLALAGRIQITAPEVSVVLVAERLTPDSLQDALRAGVRDVLPISFTPAQLMKAVAHSEDVSRQLRTRSTNGHSSEKSDGNKIVTVLSSKGGVGKSFVASNLAVLLARRDRPVALLDLDLQFGDLAIMLQLFPTRTICDAARDLDRLDDEALARYLTLHRSNVSLMAAPLEPGLAETVSADAALTIMRMLKKKFAYVIVDTPPAFTDHVLQAIDESDILVSVTTLDVPSIKNLKISFQTLGLLGVDPDRVRLVLNRADSKVGLNIREVEKTLGRSVDIRIPSSRDVPLSVNRGTPLVLEDAKSPISLALSKLAAGIEEFRREPVAEPANGRRFQLGRKR
ncbi:MAG: P-loop NTPase [Actinomycetota bacterium]